MTSLFALTIGLGAFLLFVVQPEVGKLVLPLLGGTPAVWNTCLVFFQVALLGGYLYAHLIGRLATRVQVALHLLLMATAAFVLPIAIRGEGLEGARLQAMAERPALWLFGLLIARVAAPYIIVAATAPLLQRWWARTTQATAGDPYFLYAASNAGSLLALLTYPTLIEPALTLASQARVWTAGYLLLMALLAAAGVLAWQRRSAAATAASAVPAASERLTWKRRLRWFVLAAVPVVVMLGATTYITTDVAAVPLFWVLPLSVYLVTFIIAFAPRRGSRAGARPSDADARKRTFAATMLPVAVLPPLLAIALSANSPWLPLLGAHLAGLFFAALVCHTELARDRPSTEHLTAFYLWIAAGGALGGLITTLGAPIVFRTVLEYPLGLLAACLLRPDPAGQTDRSGAAAAWRRDAIWIGLAAALAAGAALVQPIVLPDWTPGVALVPALIVAILQWHRPRRFALALGASLAAVALLGQSAHRDIFVARGFFGVVRVRATELGVGAKTHPVHLLMHGNILHGMQATSGAGRLEPTSYYGRPGPAGRVFELIQQRAAACMPPACPSTPTDGAGEAPGVPRTRVGVVGLGIGALIAYGRTHERWTFFEINPTVVDVARNSRYFSYLADTRVPYDVALGEGRLAVARQPAGSFDLLVLDAFSSDAIPTHLVTREAVAMYFRALKPDGLLLINVSNRFVSLPPVLGAIARDDRLAGRVRGYVPTEEDRDLFSSEWVVLARNEAALGAIAHDEGWRALPADGRAWTDDYSSLVSVLQWRR